MQLQAASGAQSVGVTRARSTAFRFLRKERGNSVSWEVSSSSGRVEQGCKRKDECGDVQKWGDQRAAFISYLCLQFIFLPDPVQKTFLLLWFLFLFIFFHRFHLQPNLISFLRLRQRSFRSFLHLYQYHLPSLVFFTHFSTCGWGFTISWYFTQVTFRGNYIFVS